MMTNSFPTRHAAGKTVDDPLEEQGPRVSRDSPIETIEFSRPPWLPGVEIMDVRNSYRLCRWFHQSYSICSLLDIDPGGLEWTYRTRTHHSENASLMVVEPGELHVTKSVAGVGGKYAVVMMTPKMVGALAEETGFGTTPHLVRATVGDRDLVGPFARFHASLRDGSSVLEQQSRLAECLRRLLERCGECRPTASPTVDTDAVARAREYIHAMYQEDILLDVLADAAGASRYHLCRQFSAVLGLPPHAYLVRLRVAKARELLARGIPSADVAFQVGFFDQSHLIRHFRRIFGVTPARYARMTHGAGSSSQFPKVTPGARTSVS